MIAAMAKALGDMFSRPFRKILLKSLSLTVLLFIALLAAVQLALSQLELASFPWLEPIISILAGLGIAAAFVFLAGPVTAIFAGFFLDQVAALVERTHYPEHPKGRPLPVFTGMLTGLRFGLVVLLVNLIALPFLFVGIGAIAMVIANAYLISREYFEMSSLRHLSRDEASAMRRSHSGQILLAGLIPAVLGLIPFVNLLLPMFSTAYFTHLFKSIHASEQGSYADTGRDRE
jgi:CysZ protein